MMTTCVQMFDFKCSVVGVNLVAAAVFKVKSDSGHLVDELHIQIMVMSVYLGQQFSLRLNSMICIMCERRS